jgi:hypothetical protein
MLGCEVLLIVDVCALLLGIDGVSWLLQILGGVLSGTACLVRSFGEGFADVAACHGSAWTPLSADGKRQARRLEETCTEART